MNEATLLEQAIGGLVGSGPLAIVMGFAVYKLWDRLQKAIEDTSKLRDEHTAFLVSLIASAKEDTHA